MSIPESARLAFREGEDLERAGEGKRALDAYRRAIRHAPEFVDAHRAYQNLLLQHHRRGDLLREYQSFLDEAPRSGPRRYLLGRLWSDRRRQLEEFERAVWLDPDLFFGYIGIGYVSLDLGDVGRAVGAFVRARELEPERIEPLQGLLATYGARSDEASRARALELAHEMVEREPLHLQAHSAIVQALLYEGQVDRACREVVRLALQARDDEAADLAYGILERYGTPALMEEARARLLAPGALGSTAHQVRLAAFVAQRCGDPHEALQVVFRADPRLDAPPEFTRLRLELLLSNRRFFSYARERFASRHEQGFDIGDGGESRERFLELLRRLEETPIPVGGAGAAAMERLMELGLADAAVALGRASLEMDPSSEDVRRTLSIVLRHRRFLAEIRQLFEEQYVAPDPMSLDETLEALRERSIQSLGENVVDPVVMREFPPIGAFVDPDPDAGSGIARYFDRFGTFILIGKRFGGPPEAYVMARIADSRARIEDRDVYRVVGDDLLVRSRAEFFGADIAGFAFQSFIALNASRVVPAAMRARRLLQDEGEALLDDALRVATTDEELTELSEPLSVAERSELRALLRFLNRGGRAEHYAGALLEAVEAHERAHIQDASRFLPIHADIIEKLRLFARHGFRTSEVEGWLEGRAQAHALATSTNPMAVLAAAVRPLPDRDASPPHSLGYYDLVERIVQEIDRHPGRYPEIDRRFTIVPQLDRLPDDTLRRLGRRIEASYDAE